MKIYYNPLIGVFEIWWLEHVEDNNEDQSSRSEMYNNFECVEMIKIHVATIYQKFHFSSSCSFLIC